MKTSKASPKIWKKFTRKQRQVWRDIYAICLQPEMWNPKSKLPPKKDREVAAHNIACMVVWYLEDGSNKVIVK